jgi:hypothetical protein
MIILITKYQHMQLLNQLLLILLYELLQQYEMLFEVLICKEEFNQFFL